jgi:hypothetical protein
MAFPGSVYAPPGVYTQTLYEDPLQSIAGNVRIPLLMGTGSEILTQSGLELVRGSSSSVDQRVVQEDEDARAVFSITEAGAVTLGAFDSVLNRIQTKHYPIVNGNGTGTTATDASSVNVTINGDPVVVLAIDGAKGILTLSSSPDLGDLVKVTYYFNRTDTLIMDTLSDQITPDVPEIIGAVGENYVITEAVDDTLSFLVDSEDTVEVTITASTAAGWTGAQMAAFINAAATGTSLVASTIVNNQGLTVLRLLADRDIVVGTGLANTTLGLNLAEDTGRNATFYTFQRPIVDGTNGGVTSTDPADVTVKVDGTQVIPSSVDGASGAVILPFAPEIGAVVTCQYYFNSWQDTFDYLQHRGVVDITQCGITPDRKDYIDGADFVLKDDKILWGTASTVEAGTFTTGGTYFDDVQVSTTLVDTRQYLAACTPVVNTSVSPPVENRLDFEIPLQPTTGNGRDTPLGAETYAAVANGRIDLPTDRPDLVWAYWGYSLEDAIDRGRVEVTVVESEHPEGSRMTLREPVPTGATVYATFYYNTLVDQAYTVACVSAGASGVGTYSVTNEDGTAMLTPQFGAKSALLATVTVEFPSGSERTPDCRFESPFTTTAYVGPVAETVTVTFAAQDATLAKYAVPSAGPYYMVQNASDQLSLNMDNTAGPGDLDLSTASRARIVGDEVTYDPAGTNLFEDGVVTTNNELDMMIDGVLIQAQCNTGDLSVVTPTDLEDIGRYEAGINSAARGDYVSFSGGTSLAFTSVTSTTILELDTDEASNVADYYVGWTLRIASLAGGGAEAIGEVVTVTAYNEVTKFVTVSPAFTGLPAFDDEYVLYNPDTRPVLKASTRFLAPTVIAAGEFDDLAFRVSGGGITSDCTGGSAAQLTAQTNTSATMLATDVNTAVNTALAAAYLGAGGTAGCEPLIAVSADSDGRLNFALTAQSEGVTTNLDCELEFCDAAGPTVDFAVLAGLDTDTAGGDQTKLYDQPIANTFEFTGGTTTLRLYDRLFIANRIQPGDSTNMDTQFVLDQCQLKMMGGTGTTQAGMTTNEEGEAAIRATIMPPTIFGEVGLSGGQDAAGEPVVTFFADGGTTDQNNVFYITVDDEKVTVLFTDATAGVIAPAGSADVPLGPLADPNSVIGQINAAMTTAAVTGTVTQEGAGIRFRGTTSVSSSTLYIGEGNANDVLGFDDGDITYRTAVSVEAVVSVLNSGALWNDGAGTGFAKTVRDDANAKYLFIQSMGTAGAGTTSSIAIEDAAADNALRPGAGTGATDGDGNTGEAAIDGYFVTSNDPVTGSGTANTSILNGGAGQDGNVGETYRDLVTGLTFSILTRAGGAAYPVGATLTFAVRASPTTDANLPVNTIPGIELYVANTSGITVDDTAVVETYEKGGNQPSVGDLYYVSYDYQKQDFNTALFSKQSAIEATYGAASPTNPVSLGGYLTILNGAVLVAVKQVQKDTDTDADGTMDAASEDAFLAAIDEVEGTMPGGAYPDMLVPLKGDSVVLFQYLARSCDIQSSIRYRAERTAICGLSAGTQPRAAGEMAEAVARTRLRIVYPDIITLSLSRADGGTDSYLLDGTYIAAAWAGNRASPTIDVATPWTRGRLFGFDEVARVLDAVQQNQVATRGVTVFNQRQSIIECRQGLSTDMTNVLTKTPTVITIADEVQRQARATLDKFIGIKFLSNVTTTIEGQLSKTLKQLVAAQIINTFTGVTAIVSPDDPTAAEVEAYYQPVFPLLYIVVTFNLRSSL